MRYRWSEIPALLRSEQGRKSLWAGQTSLIWPIFSLFVLVWRRIAQRKLKVIAVTGSLGKSTTARAVATALQARIPDGKSNSRYALARDLFSYSPADRMAVLEAAAASPGEMKFRALMLNPDIAVVTSIASEHILSFGSLEGTRQEKAGLVRGLSADKLVVLNADDPNVMWMAGQTKAVIVTCGFSENADFKALDYQLLPGQGIHFLIRSQEGTWPVRIGIPGRQMVFPVLAAVAAAGINGIDPETAISRLEKLTSLNGRMQLFRTSSGATLIRDDFKSNKESVRNALETMRDYPAKRKILILGGVDEILNRELSSYYRKLGSLIAEATDTALLFLHRKPFRRCKAGAVDAGMAPECLVRVQGDPLSALPLLPEDIGEGDLLLVKGKNRHRTARLSLHLLGEKVGCRIPSCLLGVDCDICELLEKGDLENPLMAPNRGTGK